MPPALSDQQALAILYDLALTLGSQVSVNGLLTKTVQRLLFHTGFPLGLCLSDLEPVGEEWVAARVEVVIGDYALARKKEEPLRLPATLAIGAASLEEAPELLARLPTRRPQRVFLRLPVEGLGVILLLGPQQPDTRLSLAELFTPILARLPTAIALCRSYEREVQHQVEQVAYYDPLTGLPNSILFSSTLRQAVARVRHQGGWLAVVYLDVDDFRSINARYGELLGDRLLVALGKRLSGHLQTGEMVGYLGGDEFALILPDLGGWDDVDERIVRILQSNRSPLVLDGESYDLSYSAGIAVLPVDADDADALLRHAQEALHQAKQESRGYFRLFDGEQDKKRHLRREMLHSLESALERRELVLYYQPKVDLRQGTVVGFEALVRWRHPQRGLLLPGQFLPPVENSDFMIALGEWAMREALDQSLRWEALGLKTRVSVNIAGRHLLLPDFADRVALVLGEVPQARPDALDIEILESSTFQDYDRVRQTMDRCRALGVSFSLDDFGTGYSSLAYLSQLPVSTIKIDQMFVRRLFDQREDPAIIQAVDQIATVFGREVVAEGVETREHGMLLASMGCSLGQGFGIGRPMVGEAVPEWVAAYRLPEEWRAAAGLAWRSSLYDIFRARHCHHLWQGRMVECVQRQEAFPADGPVCELVARVGELRGEQPEDPSLAALQQALWSVESLGARLLADGQRGAWEAARAGLAEFLQASAAVLAGLDRLAGLPERGPEVSE